MKIRLGELRAIIREAAAAELGKDLAVVIDETSNGFKATVYDPVNLEDLVLDSPEVLSDAATMSKSCIIGRVQVTTPEAPCWNAMKIASIAGPGKLMYGLAYALSPSGLLISEREPEGMTPLAIGAWKNMAAKSSRGKKKLDDIGAPETPEPIDDCEMRPEEFLNYAYESEGWEKGILSSLQGEHESLVKRLTSGNDLSRQDIESAIKSAGFAYFQSRYKAVMW